MLRMRSSLTGFAEAGNGSEPDIDMAPLIDMVFILLIFFLVTTSFVREAGIEVNRPQAATATAKQKGIMMVGVSTSGNVFMEGRKIDLRSVRGLVERFLAADPKGSVVIVADKKSETGRVIEVLDQCRLAGAKDVAVAAKRAQQ